MAIHVARHLMTSTVGQHAEFHAVSPLVMLRHGLPETSSPRAAGLNLNGDQVIRLAHIFSTEPATVRRMSFSNVAMSSRRLIAARSLQSCTACHPGDRAGAVLRSQLLGWRITCPLCGGLLRHTGRQGVPSPFSRYHKTALIGERLLDDEAERGVRTWTSPAEIARILLMRRVPRPVPRSCEPWRFRVLGAIIPNLDGVVATEPAYTSKSGPAASLATSSACRSSHRRASSEPDRRCSQMLRGQVMGQNQVRLSSAIDEIMTRTCRSVASSQLQLIENPAARNLSFKCQTWLEPPHSHF
jgi:hypothetical protein